MLDTANYRLYEQICRRVSLYIWGMEGYLGCDREGRTCTDAKWDRGRARWGVLSGWGPMGGGGLCASGTCTHPLFTSLKKHITAFPRCMYNKTHLLLDLCRSECSDHTSARFFHRFSILLTDCPSFSSPRLFPFCVFPLNQKVLSTDHPHRLPKFFPQADSGIVH